MAAFAEQLLWGLILVSFEFNVAETSDKEI